jgi:hypothetical protein
LGEAFQRVSQQQRRQRRPRDYSILILHVSFQCFLCGVPAMSFPLNNRSANCRTPIRAPLEARQGDATVAPDWARTVDTWPWKKNLADFDQTVVNTTQIFDCFVNFT